MRPDAPAGPFPPCSPPPVWPGSAWTTARTPHPSDQPAAPAKIRQCHGKLWRRRKIFGPNLKHTVIIKIVNIFEEKKDFYLKSKRRQFFALLSIL